MPAAWRVCVVGLALLRGMAGQTTAPRPPEPQPEPQSVLRITVTLVQVDAVVTDSHGRHMGDLGPADFELLQDGEPQKITYFSWVPGPPRAPGLTTVPGPPRASGLTTVPGPPRAPGPTTVSGPPPAQGPRAGTRAPLTAPPPITRTQVRRTVALVVDDMALTFPNLVRTREALKKYVEQDMQPGDLTAIIRTAGGVAILEQFTTDKRILLEAVDLLKWKFWGRQGVIPVNPIGGRGASDGSEPQYLDYGYSLATLGALSTLEQVIGGMKRLPGRKSIVFLSENLHVNASVIQAVDHLTDMANRSAVSLYTVDPSGLEVKFSEPVMPAPQRNRPGTATPDSAGTDSTAAPDMPPSEGNDGVLFPPDAARGEQMSIDSLGYLARRTGGLAFTNRNDIPACIREAVDDQLGYYLLGYSPKEGTFESGRGRAKFHRVVVRVRRSGLRVRWKSGFEGVPDELPALETDAAPASPEQQLMEALVSPFRATDLRVRLTSLYANLKNTGPMVHSMIYFDARDLGFQRGPDGLWHANVDIVVSAYRGLKQTLIQRQHREPMALRDDVYQRAQKEGLLYVFNTAMKDPGPCLLRVAVRDEATGHLGSASELTQVPDTRKGQLAVSGIRMQLGTPQLLEGARVELPISKNTEGWTQGGPAVRRYLPGQMIAYGYVVINAKFKGSPKRPNVEAFIRLFRNGELVYTGKPFGIATPMTDDEMRLAGGGVVRLGDALPVGEYLLQVVATDQNASKKHRQATQWIDFEVTQSAGAENAGKRRG